MPAPEIKYHFSVTLTDTPARLGKRARWATAAGLHAELSEDGAQLTVSRTSPPGLLAQEAADRILEFAEPDVFPIIAYPVTGTTAHED